ncbi:hypothetical protein [Bifidobacterium apri]|uniref:Uncharacterized protein n=1 Tax=Bifidobacterium apri TaxID=1769423 RepID=A0A6A2W0W2_9BIFI|nr:hypothetical protein [Bifidobacterium apri]KAB8296518.1 hypothetical protein DSM100238_1542 [Bifidobacterium apri]
MSFLPLMLWLLALVCCVTVIVMVLTMDSRESHAHTQDPSGHSMDAAHAAALDSRALHDTAPTGDDTSDTDDTGDAVQPAARPVSKSIIALHFVSLMLAMAPYVVEAEAADGIDKTMLSWYDSVEGISGAILIVLIALELWFMYRQASRAAKSEATRVKPAADKKPDHIEQAGQTGTAQENEDTRRAVMTAKDDSDLA